MLCKFFTTAQHLVEDSNFVVAVVVHTAILMVTLNITIHLIVALIIITMLCRVRWSDCKGRSGGTGNQVVFECVRDAANNDS